MITKLYCYHCRDWVEYEDARHVDDYVGEAHGQPVYTQVLVCPECDTVLEEEIYDEEDDDDAED